MKITRAEQQIINLIYLSNEEIAKKLYISIFTVKTHIHNLLKKFEAKNRTELVLKIMKDKESRVIMLSVNEINMLEAQNEALKVQNKELQQELREIKEILKGFSNKEKIMQICNEPTDNMAVIELQNRIKEVLGNNEQNNR